MKLLNLVTAVWAAEAAILASVLFDADLREQAGGAGPVAATLVSVTAMYLAYRAHYLNRRRNR